MLRLCAAIALSLCVVGSAYGQQQTAPDPPVCNRTPAVQTAILEALPTNNCASVTASDLSGITEIDLSGAGISTLAVDDFNGLNGVTTLDLSDNADLVSLPDGIFDGLTVLASFDTGGEIIAMDGALPSSSTVSVGFSATFNLQSAFVYGNGGGIQPADSYEITFAGHTNSAGRHENQLSFSLIPSPTAGIYILSVSVNSLVVNLSSISPGQHTLTIAGIHESDRATQTVTVVAEDDTPADPSVCERTPEVRDALVAIVDAIDDCALINVSHFTGLSWLDLSGAGLSTLRSTDFNDLDRLTRLDLANNNLMTLPTDVFDPIVLLHSLYLNDNPFDEGLPAALIDHLRTVAWSRLRLDMTKVNGVLDDSLELTAADASTTISLADAFVRTNYAVSDINTELIAGASSYSVDVQGSAVTAEASADAPGDGESHVLTITIVEAGEATITLTAWNEGPDATADTDDDRTSSHSLTVTVMEDNTPVDICGRTVQIRNGILSELGLAEADYDAACQTAAVGQLDTITSLDLSDESIATIRSTDFAGLTSLETLNLMGNQLTTLPEDIFADLDDLQTLNLLGNPLNEGLPNFEVLFPSGVPATLLLDLTPIIGGLPSTLATSAGATESVDISDAFVRSPSPGSQQFPADDYLLTVSNPAAATAAVMNHLLTVTGVAAGRITITVTGREGSDEVTHPQQIMVEVLPTHIIEVSPTEIELAEGSSVAVTVSLNRVREEETAVMVEAGAGLSLSADAETATQEVTLPPGAGSSAVITVWSIGDDKHTMTNRATSIVMTAEGLMPNTVEVTVLEDDTGVSLMHRGTAVNEVNVAEGKSQTLDIAYQFPQVGGVQSEADVELVVESTPTGVVTAELDGKERLTVTADGSAGESATVALIVYDGEGRETARATLTVTVIEATESDNLIFRIKVFLEGAQ